MLLYMACQRLNHFILFSGISFALPNPRPDRPEVMSGFAKDAVTPTSTMDWWAAGQAELGWATSLKQNANVAKNVIIFIGDGMGISTESAARIFQAQTRKVTGNDALLSWNTFPHAAISRVIYI